MNFKIIYLGVLLIALSGCSSSRYDNQFYRDQTGCADPWGTGEHDSNAETSSALKEFLEKESITVLRIDFEDRSTGGPTCDSCGCTTGLRILVSVPERDNDEIKKLGFTQVE